MGAPQRSFELVPQMHMKSESNVDDCGAAVEGPRVLMSQEQPFRLERRPIRIRLNGTTQVSELVTFRKNRAQ